MLIIVAFFEAIGPSDLAWIDWPSFLDEIKDASSSKPDLGYRKKAACPSAVGEN
jgi:hypothetical protein